MGYIIKSDYQKQIQLSLLNQLTQGDDAIRTAAEQAAEAEVRSYLAGLYDMEREWTPVTEWSDAAPYKAGSRVYDTEQVLYHAKFPFAVFEAQAMYKRGDKVWWKDKTYECLIATTTLGHEAALQQRNIQSLPAVNVCPDNTLIGAQYWADLGVYQIAAGVALSSTTRWVQGDNRNQQLLTYTIDIALYHLHSRLSPGNIPTTRFNRYSQAISWLKQVASGELTIDLPKLPATEKGRIRFGGNIKQINSY